MNLVASYFRELYRVAIDGWNRFWFAPADPGHARPDPHPGRLDAALHASGLVARPGSVLWPARLGRTASVWPTLHGIKPGLELFRLDPFDRGCSGRLTSRRWSCFSLLTLGLVQPRDVGAGVLDHRLLRQPRVPLALFGLDDINALLALYLAVGPCGAAYSLDRLLALAGAGQPLPIGLRIDANLAIRLIQVHMCVIYFFAGMAN